MAKSYDAVIVGAGPNGLAAAITLARAAKKVLVIEAAPTIGGGTRTAELTLPGFQHDICSAIHSLAVGSPFFQTVPLEKYGVRWLYPPVNLAHPLDDGRAAAIYPVWEKTLQTLGRDATAYRRLVQPLALNWPKLADAFLGPLRFPRHPVAMARLGLPGLLPLPVLARRFFKEDTTQALLAGMSAHSMLDLDVVASSATGLMLAATAHAVGWPMPEGGSQRITEAMAAYLQDLGGEIQTGLEVGGLEDLPECRAILLNITPRQLIRLAGRYLPQNYVEQLLGYRYGPGIFKLDLALGGPVPWTAPACRQAGTVHVGGTLPEIVASEKAATQGRLADKPFVLVAQQSLFDSTRAPAGQHTLWAYCHVPHGSTEDMTERIEAQIERFAPGFRQLILARHTFNAPEIERYNPNYVGGDINGGLQSLRQQFTRPVVRLNPYTTPRPNLFICSSATPPGGGVHGMCGYWAARAALKIL